MVKYIVFEITGRCNLRCKYCYNSKYNSREFFTKELSTQKIESILREAKEMGFELAAFSGGEPFLRKDLMGIIKKSPLPVSILTNGELINKEQIKELKEVSNFRELRFSLDGFRSHDEVRVNSNHQKIIDKIKFASSLKLNVSINTMVTRLNVNELLDLYRFIKENACCQMWRLDVPILSGRCKQFAKEVVLDDSNLFQELKKLIAIYIQERPKFRMIISNIFKSSLVDRGFYEHTLTEHPCDYALGSLTVRPNGDVSFCPSLILIFGNVNDSSLRKIMKNKNYLDFVNLKIQDIKKCSDCKYLYICGTGCRADAYELEQGIKGRDPSACSHFNHFEKYILPILSKELNQEFYSLLNKQE